MHPLSIRTKIGAVTTGSIILVAGLLCGIYVYDQTDRMGDFEQRILNDSVRSAATISYMVMPSLVENDFVRMASLVSHFSGRSDRLYVAVVDKDNRILADSRGSEIGSPLEVPAAFETEKRGQGVVRKYLKAGKQAIEVSSPVKAGDLVLGSVRVGLNTDWLMEEKGKMRRTLLVSSGAALAIVSLGIVIASSLSRRITEPILLLKRAAEGIGRGEYDPMPQSGSGDEIGGLADAFARMAGDLRDSRSQLVEKEALRESEEKLRTFFDSASDGIFMLDLEGNFIDINRAAYTRLGYSREEMLSMNLARLDPPEFAVIVPERIRKVVMQEQAVFETAHRRKDGSIMPVEVNARTIELRGKTVIFSIVRDITERKAAEERIRMALAEKEILLKEVHHRVKNNLQLVSSMLYLQSGYVRDYEAKALFEDSQKRVDAMSLIHEKLYGSKDLAKVDLREYVDGLVCNLSALSAGAYEDVKIRSEVEDVWLDVNSAIPCGLVINELVTNAIRHAFPDGRKGKIVIGMHVDGDGLVVLSVSDDGRGFPADIDFRDTQSLGLRLVTSLVGQLGGMIELDRSLGASFRVMFRA